MTKEHKLALILGFALVMVVGVLISDHFSRARRDTLDSGVVEPAGAMAFEQEPEDLDHPLAPQATEIVMGHPPAGPPRERRDGLVLTPVADGPMVPTTPTVVMGEEPASPVPQLVVQPLPPAEDPLVTKLPETDVRLGVEPLVEPARARTHVVREDETLWEIADRYYGDGMRWRVIANSNPKGVRSNGEVRAGVELQIPSGDGTTIAAAKPKVASNGSSGKYTVKPGDDLGKIASKLLGSARAWPKIYEANRDKLSDPDTLHAGVTLVIPAR